MPRADFDDPDMSLSDLFAAWPQTVTVFFRRHMLCPGCPIAPFHSIRDACLEYGVDEGLFRAELSATLTCHFTLKDPDRSARQGHADR